jgi:hypothetical protein
MYVCPLFASLEMALSPGTHPAMHLVNLPLPPLVHGDIWMNPRRGTRVVGLLLPLLASVWHVAMTKRVWKALRSGQQTQTTTNSPHMLGVFLTTADRQ